MERINDLTNKLYQEGVERGKAEAAALIEQAHAESNQILAQAKADAEQIIAEAKAQADELQQRTKAELKMYANQAIESVKNELVSVMANSILKDEVQRTVAEKEFLGRFLVALAQQWDGHGSMVVSSDKAEELKAYCATHARELLDGGLKFHQTEKGKALFSIAPADGAYRLDFGHEEFMAFLKEFLHPQLIELLF